MLKTSHIEKGMERECVWDFLKRKGHRETEEIMDFPKQWEIPLIYFSLFMREWLSTYCLLLLNARLGGDFFIAGSVVSIYINIVFRRPLMNPFITIFACASAGDWKKANVSGYPQYKKGQTTPKQIFLYCTFLIATQLSAAAAAAGTRAFNSKILGDEFVKNAAWGTGQLKFKINATENHDSCWNIPANATDIIEFPIRSTSSVKDDCILLDLQARWWFMEEVAAVLFFLVTYLHIWKWLRWDDMQENNPRDNEARYWAKLTFFSLASGGIGLMNTMTFPTANTGWHNSMYIYVYQRLRNDLVITSIDNYEPLIRALGGFVGCMLAVVYEWIVVGIEDVDNARGWYKVVYKAAHIVLYTFDQHEHAQNKMNN